MTGSSAGKGGARGPTNQPSKQPWLYKGEGPGACKRTPFISGGLSAFCHLGQRTPESMLGLWMDMVGRELLLGMEVISCLYSLCRQAWGSSLVFPGLWFGEPFLLALGTGGRGGKIPCAWASPEWNPYYTWQDLLPAKMSCHPWIYSTNQKCLFSELYKESITICLQFSKDKRFL